MRTLFSVRSPRRAPALPTRSRTWMITLAASAALGGAAHADPEYVLASAGAGSSTSGTTATADLEVELAGVAVSARGELAGKSATVLVGLAPHRIRRAAWAERCRAGQSSATCAAQPSTHDRDVVLEHRIVPFAGVRRDATRTTVVAAARLHPSGDPLGDHIELAITGIVSGRDREFIQHAAYMPGWYVAATWRVGPVVVGGEAGASGLQTRTMTGHVDPEVYALATIGLAVGR